METLLATTEAFSLRTRKYSVKLQNDPKTQKMTRIDGREMEVGEILKNYWPNGLLSTGEAWDRVLCKRFREYQAPSRAINRYPFTIAIMKRD